MTKLTNNSSAANATQIIRFKEGYFGLKLKGFTSAEIFKTIAVHGKYWSEYQVDQYLLENQKKGHSNSLKGWYFTNEAVNVLHSQGYKVFIK